MRPRMTPRRDGPKFPQRPETSPRPGTRNCRRRRDGRSASDRWFDPGRGRSSSREGWRRGKRRLECSYAERWIGKPGAEKLPMQVTDPASLLCLVVAPDSAGRSKRAPQPSPEEMPRTLVDETAAGALDDRRMHRAERIRRGGEPYPAER